VALSLTLGLTPRTARADECTGDCDGDGQVTVNELILMVNIALGSADVSACPIGDFDKSGDITVNEIIRGVNFALGQCPTGGPTPTPTPGGGHLCGNGVVNAGETCDDGGTCTGGTNAGTHCTQESDCTGTGICEQGTKQFFACNDDNGCPGGKCIHCKTFGGDGCAANCTAETDVTLSLLHGVVQGLSIKPGTSGAVVHGDILTIPLPLGATCKGGTNHDKACSGDGDCPGGTCSQAVQTLTLGQPSADGNVPVSIKAQSIQFPRIPVSSIACACLRGVAAKTCGGTLYDIDGLTLSTDCTADFTDGDSVCTAAGKLPCSFLHGPGNASSGTIGCGAGGYSPTDVLFDLDSGGSSGIPGKPIITLSGSGPMGSALLLSNNAIGTVTGSCSGNDTSKYGADKELCTDDDPQESRGNPSPQINVTGTGTGMIENANGTDGDDLLGPYMVTGNPLVCSDLLNNHTAAGAGLAGAFVSLNQPTLGDIIVTSALVGQ